MDAGEAWQCESESSTPRLSSTPLRSFPIPALPAPLLHLIPAHQKLHPAAFPFTQHSPNLLLCPSWKQAMTDERGRLGCSGLLHKEVKSGTVSQDAGSCEDQLIAAHTLIHRLLFLKLGSRSTCALHQTSQHPSRWPPFPLQGCTKLKQHF